MKKLIGIKNGFSSFENKEMKNLQTIVGGRAAESQKSVETSASCGGGYECDKYTDSGRYLGRVEVGC
jgi:putative peptide modification target (TIGR04139 family)